MIKLIVENEILRYTTNYLTSERGERGVLKVSSIKHLFSITFLIQLHNKTFSSKNVN